MLLFQNAWEWCGSPQIWMIKSLGELGSVPTFNHVASHLCSQGNVSYASWTKSCRWRSGSSICAKTGVEVKDERMRSICWCNFAKTRHHRHQLKPLIPAPFPLASLPKWSTFDLICWHFRNVAQDATSQTESAWKVVELIISAIPTSQERAQVIHLGTVAPWISQESCLNGFPLTWSAHIFVSFIKTQLREPKALRNLSRILSWPI